MKKSTQREVDQAIKFAPIEPAYAASTLAGAHRAASKADQAQIVDLIKSLNLSQFVSMFNGCVIAKAAA